MHNASPNSTFCFWRGSCAPVDWDVPWSSRLASALVLMTLQQYWVFYYGSKWFRRDNKLFLLKGWLKVWVWVWGMRWCEQCVRSLRCRWTLVKNSLQTTLWHSSFTQVILYCRMLLRPSVILPMKVNRLCAWISSKFLVLPLPLHIAGVTFLCCQF